MYKIEKKPSKLSLYPQIHNLQGYYAYTCVFRGNKNMDMGAFKRSIQNKRKRDVSN